MGYGRFEFLHFLGAVVWGVASFVALAVILAVIALLVRFLLVATTAAKIYVALNARDAAAANVVEPSPVVAETPPVVVETPPDTKPRKPKNPPAV